MRDAKITLTDSEMYEAEGEGVKRERKLRDSEPRKSTKPAVKTTANKSVRRRREAES